VEEEIFWVCMPTKQGHSKELWVPFAYAEKQAEILFQLIFRERKSLFWLKKQTEKYRL
jgi:hypothetical protein